MSDFIPIQYRDFYDIPRIFVVEDAGVNYLFDAAFNRELDDYPDTYAVSILPRLGAEELAGSWASLSNRSIGYLASVHVSAVRFDPTRRQGVERSFLRSVTSGDRETLTLDGQPVDPNIIKAASFNEGWIEVCEFESLPDGGKRLVTRVDAQKGAEEPVVQRRFGHVSALSKAA
jgi:hypothetical protein